MRASNHGISKRATFGVCLSVLTLVSGPFLLFGATPLSAEISLTKDPILLARAPASGDSGGGNGDEGAGGDGGVGTDGGSGDDGTGGDGNGDGTGGDGNGDGTGGGGSGDGTGGGGSGDGTGGDGNGDGTGGNGNGDGTGGDGNGDGAGGDGSGDGTGGGGSGDGTGGDGDGDGTGGGSSGDGTGGDGNGDGTGGDGNGDGTGGDGNGDGTGGEGNGDGTGGGGSGDGTGGDSNGDGTGGGGSGDGTGGDGNGDGTGGDGNGDGTGGDGNGNGDGTGGDGNGNGDGTGGDGNGDGTGGDGTGGNGEGTSGGRGGDNGNVSDGGGSEGSIATNGNAGAVSSTSGNSGTNSVTGSRGGPDANERVSGAAPSQPQLGTTFRSDRQRRGPVVTVRGSGNPEVVVIGPAAQSQAAVDALAAVGVRFLRTKRLGSMGLQVLVFEFPRGGRIAAVDQALRAAAPSMDADFHNVYEFAQFSPRVYAPKLVAPNATNGCRVPGRVRIGMIDGPVNPAHPALAGASVRTHSLLASGERSVGASHGTGVAALMVGQDPNGNLSGFAQGADLYAVSIFTSRLGAERTNVERIASALDYLIARDVRLINMSFTGPNNNVLGVVLDAASSAGAVMIAAVGTDGTPGGSLPAGSPSVIGVTAVDARLRKFSAANSGPQVEFAAPGVDIYVAKGNGGGYETGTSFAAPIVTANAAALQARGRRSLSQIRAGLQSNAQDLGSVGRDNSFGHGLVRFGGC